MASFAWCAERVLLVPCSPGLETVRNAKTAGLWGMPRTVLAQLKKSRKMGSLCLTKVCWFRRKCLSMRFVWRCCSGGAYHYTLRCSAALQHGLNTAGVGPSTSTGVSTASSIPPHQHRSNPQRDHLRDLVVCQQHGLQVKLNQIHISRWEGACPSVCPIVL